MNKDAKIYGGIAVVTIILYVASSSLDIAGLNDLFTITAVLGVIGVAAKIVQDKKIGNKLKKYSQNKSSGTNHSTDQCKEIAQEWAKENFHGKINSKKGVSFDWTQSSTQPAQIYDFRDDQWIDIRYFYSPHGPKNKGVLIFVDATNGEHYASQPVDKHEMKQNPFNYLESYRQTKRFAGRITHGDEENQNIKGLTGIPVTELNTGNGDQ